jgi:hypothetical protein
MLKDYRYAITTQELDSSRSSTPYSLSLPSSLSYLLSTSSSPLSSYLQLSDLLNHSLPPSPPLLLRPSLSLLLRTLIVLHPHRTPPVYALLPLTHPDALSLAEYRTCGINSKSIVSTCWFLRVGTVARLLVMLEEWAEADRTLHSSQRLLLSQSREVEASS